VIELASVDLDEHAERLVLEVLRSGRLVQGPMVERFEHAFAATIGTRYAVAVDSGSAALVLALQALGVGPGDEVVTTPFTFVATLNAILQVGATARFADITPADFNLDVAAVEAAITARTAALLPVHLYGHPAALAELTGIAKRHGLPLIEDAAQAHGARLGGRRVGTFGTGCFSFYATKNMTTGEGGMVTTDDAGVAERVRLLRNQGMREAYKYEVIGANSRMTEMAAALGLSELARLDERTAKRRHNAARLTAGLQGTCGLTLPTEAPGAEHVYHQYTARVAGDAVLSRDALVAGLGDRGVRAGVYYPRPVYDHRCYAEHRLIVRQPMPEAERAAAEVVSLPVHPNLTAADTDRVVAETRGLLDG
jgi:perosamine synthetase